jgi:hypothetical protein
MRIITQLQAIVYRAVPFNAFLFKEKTDKDINSIATVVVVGTHAYRLLESAPFSFQGSTQQREQDVYRRTRAMEHLHVLHAARKPHVP